jgi:hypothetical protein
MRRSSLLPSALAILAFPFALGGCNDDYYEETDLVGTVLLSGNPVAGANVRVIFAGFVQDTEVTAADGTFVFDDYPEDWDPFFIEAFYIDPVTLNEYKGVTPFLLTNSSGRTNVGDIVLVQTFPATAGVSQTAQGHLDGDTVEDLVVANPEWLAVWLSSGGTRVLDTAAGEGGPFGAVAIRDEDGDGVMDVAVDRPWTGAADVHAGDGRGGFAKR